MRYLNPQICSFFIQAILAIWCPFHFHMSFRISFSISEKKKKKTIGILIRIALNLQITLDSIATLIILIIIFLATPLACGSSWARDRTHATFITINSIYNSKACTPWTWNVFSFTGVFNFFQRVLSFSCRSLAPPWLDLILRIVLFFYAILKEYQEFPLWLRGNKPN